MFLNYFIILIILVIIIIVNISKYYFKYEFLSTTKKSNKYIRLCTQYYITKLKGRQTELDNTLIENINNNIIDEIVLFIEKDYNFDNIKKKVNNFNKVKLVKINKRLDYKTCFDYCNKYTRDNIINILANSDMYFNKSLSNLHSMDLNNVFLALLRHNLPKFDINI